MVAERSQALHAFAPGSLNVAPWHEDASGKVVRQELGLLIASVDLVDAGVVEDVLQLVQQAEALPSSRFTGVDRQQPAAPDPLGGAADG